MALHQNGGLDTLAHKASQVDTRLLEANVVAMDLALPHSTVLGDLVRRLIREDPRTEELKLLKQEFNALKEDVRTTFKRFSEENAKTSADDRELFNRIATDVAAIKKQRTDLEPLEKKVAGTTESVRVMNLRLNTLDQRIAVVESK
jgi:hypothetical protein